MRTIELTKNKLSPLNKDIFKALWDCRSTDPDRKNLEPIFFDSKESQLVATNGKCLMVYKIKAENILEKFGNEDGYFKLEGNYLIEINPVSEYPEYQKVLLKENEKCKKVEINNCSCIEDKMIQVASNVTGTYFNGKHFKPFSKIEDMLEYNYVFKNNSNIIQFHNRDNTLTIVVAPNVTKILK